MKIENPLTLATNCKLHLKKTKQIKNTIKQRKEERFSETKNTNLVRVFLINKLEMMLFFLFVVVFFALRFR